MPSRLATAADLAASDSQAAVSDSARWFILPTALSTPLDSNPVRLHAEIFGRSALPCLSQYAMAADMTASSNRSTFLMCSDPRNRGTPARFGRTRAAFMSLKTHSSQVKNQLRSQPRSSLLRKVRWTGRRGEGRRPPRCKIVWKNTDHCDAVHPQPIVRV